VPNHLCECKLKFFETSFLSDNCKTLCELVIFAFLCEISKKCLEIKEMMLVVAAEAAKLNVDDWLV
jgi:hypothetical protein